MAHKVIDGDKLDNEMRVTADAIRQKLGVPDQLQWKDNSGFASDVDRIVIKSGGYEQGYEDAWDICWDNWQKWGTKDDYYATFSDWNYKDIKPKHTIFGRLQSAFQGTKGDHFEPSEIKLSFAKCTNLYQMLYRATFKTIGVIDLSAISQAVNTGSMFNQMENLERVEKIIMPSKEYLNSNDNFLFYLCSKLTHIIFEGELIQKINFMSSPLLDDESVQSVIDALADLSSGTAQTLTLHSTIGNKLTDEQKATITAKNWTLVY